ncbi:ABC transporter permease [Clostridium swellfunianum]|uniref:ABC transporter permease n=1 Tax=Clostridium swellfunianum TaxID=1367462 RepID=UPI00202FACFB|nr:ABC transporter permease [Clostridium swellfunianum]MCM0648933.1 ABC transporter permease [Clostridium swellfunianum]
MLNLLRADLYKLRRSKSFFICLGILAAIVAYIIIDFGSSAHIKEQFSPSTFHWTYMMFKEKSFLPYFMPVFQAIFITMLITSEYSTGTIKDSVSLGFSRMKIYMSKLITVSVGSILMMLAAFITTGITSILVFGIYGSFSMYDLLLFIRMFLIQSLLYTAYASVFLMIAFLIKNIGGTMAFSIFFSLILGSLSSIFGNGYLGRVMLLMNFSPTAMPNPQAVDIRIAIAVALSYLILCFSIGGFTFKNQDIK